MVNMSSIASPPAPHILANTDIESLKDALEVVGGALACKILSKYFRLLFIYI